MGHFGPRTSSLHKEGSEPLNLPDDLDLNPVLDRSQGAPSPLKYKGLLSFFGTAANKGEHEK
eukprot:2159304-Pyramimonas_sp.AAC.1